MAPILMNWKSTVVVSGAGLLATVFGWVSSPVVPQRAPARAAAAAPQSTQATAVSDIQQEAARLQSRLVPDATFRQPSRNPFRFVPRTAPRSDPAVAAPVPESVAIVPIAPPRPNIHLRGIASDTVDGALQRTAILTTDDAGLLLVREGETAGIYRLTKIEDEAVELSGPDGTMRLSLGR